MEKLFNTGIIKQIKEVFEGLQQPVQILLFTSQKECDYCATTLQLLQEVVALSDQLALSVYDVDEAPEVARQYKVERTPGVVIAAQDGSQVIDYGIRYLGIPAGHEFTALINDVVMVSSRDSSLSPETRAFLQSLTQPLLLQVFSTPT